MSVLPALGLAYARAELASLAMLARYRNAATKEVRHHAE